MRNKLQKIANTFADWRASWFARKDMRDAASLKVRR
jgi:hypothetical protein